MEKTKEINMDLANQSLQNRRAGYPNDTCVKTNAEWVIAINAPMSFVRKLSSQQDLANRIASDRCSGCNYTLRANKISEGVYELA